ncbi:LamG-like jellyroll fold domain-containing protein [Actinosynnema sp. CS-041913]|uniref:LamG-like jellyroll fold domain-containing protein n=1 Tax=Actinosynnema sp. CS-041913 TaxID=3239917 RepID=UPI003D8EBA62
MAAVSVPVAVAAAVVPDSAPDEATAVRYAAQGDKSVVVDSATTETEEVRANPDGSMTFVEHVRPVRVRRGAGWVPVDLTLERKTDGSFGPRASTVDVVFSGGGTGSAGEALAKVVKGEHAVGLGWVGDLPEPVVDGASLTYPNVLPDVDLKVEAHHKGFSELLVVKTAQAARNPALDRITFPTHAENVRVVDGPGSGGDLVAEDPGGAPVFVGDASRMWDSTGGGVDGDLDEGDRQAAMTVEVTSEAVAIVPDQAFLDSPATTYPVSLDPEYFCGNCGKTHHVVVQDLWPEARNLDATSAPLDDLKAGRVNAAEMNADRDGVSRSYLQMHTGPIVGRYIHSAKLSTTVVHTYSCAPSATELWLVDWIDGNTRWNYQPRWQYVLSENNRANNARNCPSNGDAGFDATKAVREAASGGWTWTNFMLKAKDENHLDGSWRKFDLGPYLEVRYNSYPNPPVDMGIEGWGPNASDALECHLGARRAVVGTRTPRLRARLSDPDGNVMDAAFRVFKGPHDGYTWSGQEIHVGDVWSGTFAEAKVPSEWIANDGVHTWHLWSGDHQLSSWAPLCEFEVDTVKPNTPAVSSTDYPATGVHGTVGRTGTFTFRTNGNTGMNGAMDVRRYRWSLNNDTATTYTVDVPAGGDGTVTVPITPMKAGTNVLYVSAFDRAGNRSATNAVYTFRVAEPAVPLASWRFDESSGTVAEDNSGGGRPLTLTGGASFASGYEGNALSLDGTSGYAASASRVLDTSRAFSVSAWVKLDRLGGHNHTVVSQDGNRLSAPYLFYANDIDRWAMTLPDADVDWPTFARITSAAPPALGVWTHLVGTYEPTTRTMSLYVDGKLEGTATGNSWGSSGSLVVGAAKWQGNRGDHLPGAVDRVSVWDRVISVEEVAAVANSTVPRARLALDEQTGTTTLEEVSGQQATLSDGVTWAGTPVDPDDPNQVPTSEDKWLNFGASGSREVTASRPALLRTDRSFSVSAWVRLETVDTPSGAVISLGDTSYTPFQLQYRPENKQWAFLLNRHADRSSWQVALSDGQVQAGQWVHLVGTYDFAAGRMSLYVDGVRQTVNFLGTSGGNGVSSWNGSGPLWLGRGVWGGTKSDPWRGDVDDTRVYSGVLTPEQIDNIHYSTTHR